MLKLNLGCGDRPLDGFVNLDAKDGWRFEDGLGQYDDASVDAITVSHALMYVPADRWEFVFGEFARVLKVGGIIRITEDDTANPESERFGGYPDAATLTAPIPVLEQLGTAGLTSVVVLPEVSFYQDDSLIQNGHGHPPKVFHVEGIR